MDMKPTKSGLILLFTAGLATAASASEAELKLPPLSSVHFPALGGASGYTLMLVGLGVCLLASVFGIWQYQKTKALPVHDSMRNVSNIIWETCKSYLFQQGKFLAILWVLIGICISYYFGFLVEHKDAAGQPLNAGHVAFNVAVI